MDRTDRELLEILETMLLDEAARLNCVPIHKLDSRFRRAIRLALYEAYEIGEGWRDRTQTGPKQGAVDSLLDETIEFNVERDTDVDIKGDP
jgi:hypothetical protein